MIPFYLYRSSPYLHDNGLRVRSETAERVFAVGGFDYIAQTLNHNWLVIHRSPYHWHRIAVFSVSL
jgi:hypothetical protein